MRNIPKQPTMPLMPQEKDDEFKVTVEEAEKLMKEAKKVMKNAEYLTPITIKSCSYLLPCGICDKTNQMCSQYL